MYDLKLIGERIAKAKERARKAEVVETAIPLPREDEKKSEGKPTKTNGKKVPARVLAGYDKKSEELREKIKEKKEKAKEKEFLPPREIKKKEKEERTKKEGPRFFVPADTPERVGGLSPIQLSVIAYCFLNQDKKGVSVATLIEDLLSDEEKVFHAKRKVSDGPQRIIRNALRAPVKRGFLVRTIPGHYTFSKPKPGRDGKITQKDSEVGSFLVEFKRQHLKKKF